MEKTFIICAWISSPNVAERFRSNLFTHIAERYVEVMNNVFIIRSRDKTETCVTIRSKLTTFMNDVMLFIMETSQHAAWRLPLLTGEELDKIL